eukprot:gene9540-biopygen15257
MPDTVQEWHTEQVILKHFLENFGDKNPQIASKHAPQRRVYARSVQTGPIDDRAHARKMRFEECDPQNTGNHQNAEIHAGCCPRMAYRAATGLRTLGPEGSHRWYTWACTQN